MAREATARLYDVDEDTMVFKRFGQRKSYDQGTITFNARKGKLISLAKLHESIWATRLSGGTSSGVIALEVRAIGRIVQSSGEVTLRVAGTDSEFVVVPDVKAKPKDAKRSVLDTLRRGAGSDEQVSVTGYVEGWVGRWPGVLRMPPSKRPKLMVTDFRTAGKK